MKLLLNRAVTGIWYFNCLRKLSCSHGSVVLSNCEVAMRQWSESEDMRSVRRLQWFDAKSSPTV